MEALLKKGNLARYIISKFRENYGKQISPIKLQKSLYFLFAMWGGKIYATKGQEEDTEADDIYGAFNPYLFDANFYAWKYGPVEIDVYHLYKDRKYNLDEIGEILDFNTTNNDEKDEAQRYIDNILGRIFITSDFALVDLSHEDKCWRAVSSFSGKMDNDGILAEYANKKL